MSHGCGPESGDSRRESPFRHALAKLLRLTHHLNEWIMGVATIAILAASCILTLSVVTRYFLKVSTDWQDEASVFLLVGSIFMCGAYVQSYRGHVGIEAVASVLPEDANRVRKFIVDIASLAFCAFFSLKSWAMFYEAFVGGHTTSSTWAPPLWIPYGLMAIGMTNLSLQLLLQVPTHLTHRKESR